MHMKYVFTFKLILVSKWWASSFRLLARSKNLLYPPLKQFTWPRGTSFTVSKNSCRHWFLSCSMSGLMLCQMLARSLGFVVVVIVSCVSCFNFLFHQNERFRWPKWVQWLLMQWMMMLSLDVTSAFRFYNSLKLFLHEFLQFIHVLRSSNSAY